MRRGERFSRRLMLAWIGWALSLLLPALAIRADGSLIRGDILFPGWQVALAAEIESLSGMSVPGRIAVRIMGLTNLIMLASPLTEIVPRPTIKRVFLSLAVGAACLNASALLFHFACMLSYGYWVWLASFVLLAVTLGRDRPPPRAS